MGPINIAVLVERIDNLSKDVNTKHTQNRNDIHALRNSVQTAVSTAYVDKTELLAAVANNKVEIAELATKIGIYAALGGGIAGIVSAIVLKLIHL